MLACGPNFARKPGKDNCLECRRGGTFFYGISSGIWDLSEYAFAAQVGSERYYYVFIISHGSQCNLYRWVSIVEFKYVRDIDILS